jgi:O-antigen/teichoic acid export membrane protein
MESRLIKAMQFYHLSRKGGAFLVSIVLAKVGLSLDQIGIYETWIYLAMLFSFFWVEGLIKTYLSSSEQEGRNLERGMSTTYVLFLIISLALGAVLFLAKGPLLALLTGQEDLEHFNLLLLYLVLSPPMMLLPFFYQVTHQRKGIIAAAILASFGFTLLVSVPLLLDYGLRGSLYGMIAYAVLGNLWMMVAMLWRYKGDWLISIPFARALLVMGWPLVVYTVFQSLTTVVDATLVQWFYKSKADFAIFRYGARELPIVIPLTAGVVNLALPLLVREWSQGLDLIKRESRKLMHLLFPIGAVLMILSEWLFGWVYNSDFQDSAAVFNVYLLLIASQLLFPQTLIIARRKNQILMMVSVLEVGVNIVLTWALIHNYGMIGVAWATVIAYMLEKGLLMFYVHKVERVPLSSYTDMRLWSLYSLALLLIYWLLG